ncbi:MAG: hypothetical protein H6739_15785 [Alphaproteobacteria bacterium]|nr:hypothetical protein [Alphaproteobacteria bacterium]
MTAEALAGLAPSALVRALQSASPAMVLQGPARVLVDRAERLTLTLYRADSARAVAAAPLGQHAVLVGVDLDNNEVFVGRLEPPSAQPPSPVDPAALSDDDVVVQRARPEARALLKIPWRPGRWRFVALLRDQRSSVVEVELAYSGARFQAAELAAHLEALRARMHPRAVSPPPGDPLPDHCPRPDTPTLPEGVGITLAMAPAAVLGEPAALRGAFRLIPRPHERTASGAILALSILALDATRAAPRVLRLRVSGQMEEGAPDGACVGAFALDAFADRRPPQEADVNVLWAASGAALAGPIVHHRVPRAWLPAQDAGFSDGEEEPP